MRIRNLLATETIPRTRTLPVLAATLLVGIFLLPMAGAEPSVETPRTTANATETARGFVIVVHEGDPATSISPEHLRTLYLKRGPAQSRINEPIDLIETSPTREAFSRVILDQEVEDVTSYWERMAFSGRGVPPLEKGNEAEVLDLVYENPGYIGYVSPATPLPPGIKILSID